MIRKAKPCRPGRPAAGGFSSLSCRQSMEYRYIRFAVHPGSAAFIASIGTNGELHPDFGTVWQGAPNGIPYVVVGGDQPPVAVTYTAYGDESDPGPFPIPDDAGGGRKRFPMATAT